MREATSPFHHYTFMAWYFVKYRDNFIFTFNLLIASMHTAWFAHLRLLVDGC
jgi:hypothetical protein